MHQGSDSEHEPGDRLYRRLPVLLCTKQCEEVSHDRRLFQAGVLPGQAADDGKAPPAEFPADGNERPVGLENLNLRGGFKAGIMNYIAEKHPGTAAAVRGNLQQENRSYFEAPEKKAVKKSPEI